MMFGCYIDARMRTSFKAFCFSLSVSFPSFTFFIAYSWFLLKLLSGLDNTLLVSELDEPAVVIALGGPLMGLTRLTLKTWL